MNVIDWSKAPADATHYGVATYSNTGPDWCEAFYKNVGGCWMICFPESGDWHGDASRNDDWKYRFATLIERPAGWAGEGLPPVGTVCECRSTLTGDDWKEVEILAHFKAPGAVAAFVPTSGYRQVAQAIAGCFRPIRSPDQIAAEERKGAIHEMVDHLKRWTSVQELCGHLYDAGYRKVLP